VLQYFFTPFYTSKHTLSSFASTGPLVTRAAPFGHTTYTSRRGSARTAFARLYSPSSHSHCSA